MANSTSEPTLLNGLPDEGFFARHAEVRQLFDAGLDVARGLQSSCFLSGQRKSGKTEILKRAYKRLFWEQEAVIPFFTSLPKSVPSAETFCREYFLTSALQCIGFIRKDARLVASEKHDLNRIVQLAYESKLSWLTDAVDHFHQFTKNKDLQALARLAILFPSSIAAKTGLCGFVFLDDFQHLSSVASPSEMSLLTSVFLQALESRQAPHCLAGASQPLFQSLFRSAELPGCVEVIPLRPLRPTEAQEILEGLCLRFDVSLEKDLGAFIVEQLDCNPFYLRSLVQCARRQSKQLSSARHFASLYNFEVIEGGLQLYFSSLLHSAPLTAVERIKALEFLHYCAHAPLEFGALHYLRGRELSEGVDFENILNALAALGIIDYSLGVVSNLRDPVLKDWVVWNFSHKIGGAALERVQFDMASTLLRKFGELRQSRTGKTTRETLQAVLASMNCQTVLASMFHYEQGSRFKLKEVAILQKEAAARDEAVMVLPEIVSVSLPVIRVSPGGDSPRSLVLARGFERGVYSDDFETAWLSGSVAGSVGLDEIQRFYRLCESVKRQEGLKQTQFWMVAEEKVNQAALSFAESHGLFTSSLEQLGALAQEILQPDDAAQGVPPSADLGSYEVTIPMSDDSELVAVRAFEQIADGIDMSEKAKGQVRMALMEACINMKEALAKDTGKIHLSFELAGDRVLIRLRPDGLDGLEADLIKAWGMKMLRTLMDEVKLQRTAQGFALHMVKRLVAAANAKG